MPKYAAGDQPETTADRWAYFFLIASSLQQVPAALSQAPYATALEVARVANRTEAEGTEYEGERMAAQDFRGGLSLAESRGMERGME